MTERAHKLLDEALTLTTDERANLAAELIASLDGRPDEGAGQAWAAEIERRARRAISGETAGEDWDEAVAKIEQELKKG